MTDLLPILDMRIKRSCVRERTMKAGLDAAMTFVREVKKDY
jgi:hypothetical protein